MTTSFQARGRRPREAEVNAGARIPQEESTSREARIIPGDGNIFRGNSGSLAGVKTWEPVLPVKNPQIPV